MIKRGMLAWCTMFAASAAGAQACELPGRVDATLAWLPPASHPSAVQVAGYGLRLHPILGINRLHTGLDWMAPFGSDVRAAQAGRIVEAERSGEFGNRIVIDHGGGWQTTYSHLQHFAPTIAISACVSAGQIIATVGNTGLSSTPHLHFEVLRRGEPVDPLAP